MSSVYIVPTAFLTASPPDAYEWHATTIPADQTQSLLVVDWRNPKAEPLFESQPGVLLVGQPWEPLSAQAAPLLSSLQDSKALALAAGISVATALRKIQWPGVRLVR